MYTRTGSKNAFVTTCSAFPVSPYFVRDEPHNPMSDNDLLGQYIGDARNIFRTECDMLLHTDRVFTKANGERLLLMLKLLVDARKTWQEEHDSKKAR